MLKWFKKLHRHFISSKLKQKLEHKTSEKTPNPLSSNLQENLTKIKEVFSNASDIVFRQFEIGSHTRIKAFIVYVDGLVNEEFVQMNLMKSLMIDMHISEVDDELNQKNTLNIIHQRILTLTEVSEVNDFQEVVEHVLSGDTALFLEGFATALIVNLRGWETRNVTPPDTEVVVRGPREGFTETLRTSTSLLRRKIKNVEKTSIRQNK